MDVYCHRSFLPGTSLEKAVILTAQASSSHCSTFRIMCDVPSILLLLLLLLLLGSTVANNIKITLYVRL